MKILFFTVLLFLFSVLTVVAQDVQLEVIREEIVNQKDQDVNPKTRSSSGFNFPTTDVPAGDRRIIFRFLNKSEKEIVVYGLAYDSTFQPAGFLIPFDAKTEDWSEPTREREAGERNSLLQKDQRVLQPGESLEFSALLSATADKDKKFKRTVYYSLIAGNCQPRLVEIEFSLSK